MTLRRAQGGACAHCHGPVTKLLYRADLDWRVDRPEPRRRDRGGAVGFEVGAGGAMKILSRRRGDPGGRPLEEGDDKHRPYEEGND